VNERTFDLKTICRDCIFAEFTDDAVTQTGCKLGRLDKFRDKGKTKPIEDENGLEYYEISTLCNTCRDKNWEDKFTDSIPRVIKEVELKIDAIILDDSNHDNWHQDVMVSVQSLLNQVLKPCRIVVVVYNKMKAFSGLKELLDKAGIKYDIVNVLEYTNNSYLLLNHGISRCRNQYYSVVESGNVLPNDYFAKLNKIINNDLDQFSMIEPVNDTGSLTGLTVQRKLHQMIQSLTGKIDLNIIEAVKALAKEQNLEHMVKTL